MSVLCTVICFLAASLSVATLGVESLNQTLCANKCSSDCKTYISPLSCYNPSKLWPHDPQWGATDIRDSKSLFSVNRTFYKSSDGTCTGIDGDPDELPMFMCIGPFGKPRPWGELRPV
jgi:hypothetical protein